MKRYTTGFLTITISLLALNARAESNAKPSTDGEVLDSIVVSGSRLPKDLSSVPGSVTVLDQEDIEKQRAVTNDLTNIMEMTVPGLSISSFPNWGTSDQPLRGRKPAVAIDGVPTTTPLRDGGRDLRTVAPSAVERIEIIRGSTALYGLGGAGGLINYVTKVPGEGPPEFFTQIGSTFSLTHIDDSFNGFIEQGANGRLGRFSFVASGSYEKYSSLFDSDGDLMPPDPNKQGGVADNEIYSLFGKVGFDLTDAQRIQLSVVKYHAEQDTNHRSGVGQYLVTKTPAREGKDPNEQNQFADNMMISARYTYENLWGSNLSVFGYYSEYETRFSFYGLPNFPPNGAQTLLDSNKRGVRLDIETPLSVLSGGRLLWGADFSYDETSQPLNDGRLYAPLMKQSSYAPFAQAELDVTSWLKLRGGVRYEDISLDIPTFTTIPASLTRPGGKVVQGGKLPYSETVYNLGVVVDVTDNISLFAGYSQGFSVADIGASLRTTTVASVTEFQPKAQLIDNYEAGIRVQYGPVRASLASYISKSNLGASYGVGSLEVIRAKERVDGYEATFDWMISDKLRAGGTYSHTGGLRDLSGDGVLDERLDTTRIGPPKLTAYMDYEPLPNWNVRLQLMNAATINRFPNDPLPIFGRAKIEGYTLVDLTTSFPWLGGTVGIGVKNLLNEDYFTLTSQRQVNNAQYVQGVGRTATITYTLRY